MLKSETLDALKEKMPYGHAELVIKAYKQRYQETISRWTVGRFFKGDTYSEKLHNAILDVASTQQSLKEKTESIIND